MSLDELSGRQAQDHGTGGGACRWPLPARESADSLDRALQSAHALQLRRATLRTQTKRRDSEDDNSEPPSDSDSGGDQRHGSYDFFDFALEPTSPSKQVQSEKVSPSAPQTPVLLSNTALPSSPLMTMPTVLVPPSVELDLSPVTVPPPPDIDVSPSIVSSSQEFNVSASTALPSLKMEVSPAPVPPSLEMAVSPAIISSSQEFDVSPAPVPPLLDMDVSPATMPSSPEIALSPVTGSSLSHTTKDGQFHAYTDDGDKSDSAL